MPLNRVGTWHKYQPQFQPRFTRTLQGNLGFATVQVQVLVEDRYDTQDMVTVLKIYQDKRMVSVEIQDPCEPRWYIFCIQRDKVPPVTVFVGEGFDAVKLKYRFK